MVVWKPLYIGKCFEQLGRLFWGDMKTELKVGDRVVTFATILSVEKIWKRKGHSKFSVMLVSATGDVRISYPLSVVQAMERKEN